MCAPRLQDTLQQHTIQGAAGPLCLSPDIRDISYIRVRSVGSYRMAGMQVARGEFPTGVISSARSHLQNRC